jgi:hypothetical protein
MENRVNSAPSLDAVIVDCRVCAEILHMRIRRTISKFDAEKSGAYEKLKKRRRRQAAA